MTPSHIPDLVSIIVPVFNAKASLDACIESLTTQDYRDIEIIAVNDGSSDDSAALLAQWVAREVRLTVLTHSGGANRGVAASRNLGLSKARGAYLWFVDADDRVRPGAVSRLQETAEARVADVVAFNGEEHEEGVMPHPVYQQVKPTADMTGEEWVSLSCRQKECPHLVWLRFYRRTYLQSIGLQFREGIVHEDIAWITEGDLRAPRFVYTDAVLYDYLRNAQSITGNASDASLLRRAESLFEIIEQLRDINVRVPMKAETRDLLRAELVGQGLQVDRLRQHLSDAAMRRRIDERVHQSKFWRSLWKDATRLTRKRQLAQAMLRDWLHS